MDLNVPGHNFEPYIIILADFKQFEKISIFMKIGNFAIFHDFSMFTKSGGILVEDGQKNCFGSVMTSLDP